MTANFDRAVKWLLAWETAGGKKIRVLDMDGRTLAGINERANPTWVARWWDRPDAEVMAAAADYYHERYWIPTGCNDAAPGIDMLAFDASVNAGLAHGQMIASCNTTLAAMCLRVERYAEIAHANPERAKFLVGWLRRLVDCWRTLL